LSVVQGEGREKQGKGDGKREENGEVRGRGRKREGGKGIAS